MLTLGLLFSQLFDTVSQMIQQFQDAGLLLEVNGGAQVQNLISQAKTAFNDSLNTAATALTGQQQQAVSGIQGLIDDLKKNVLDNFMGKALTVANALPFANNIPQVSSLTGVAIAPNIDGDPTVQISGNFIDIGGEGYDAQLNLGANSIPNTTKSTETLTFLVPKNKFVFAPNTISYVPFSVTIPYRRKELGGILHKKDATTFNFMFIVLPNSPGTFVLQTTKLVDVRQEAADTCGGLVWDAGGGDDEATRGCDMSDGWQCMRETVTYHFSRQEGDRDKSWVDLGNQSTSTFVGWRFKAEYHRIGPDSGKLTVDLNYRKFKNVQQQQVTPGDNTPLQWGESKVLAVDATATWNLTYIQFNGVSKEYASSDQSNPYLKITSAGNQISLKVIPQ